MFIGGLDIGGTRPGCLHAGAGERVRRTSKSLENDVLRVDGRIDFSKCKDMEPLYAKYNVGHFERSFTLSGAIDKEKIEDGVLTLTRSRPNQLDRFRRRPDIRQRPATAV